MHYHCSFILLFIISFIFFNLVSCNAKKDQTNFEIIQDMLDQVSIKPQDWDPKQNKLSPLRVPPEGSIPRNFDHYPYKNNPKEASRSLKNPLKGKTQYEVMMKGRNYYENFCALCHGNQGRGDGRIASFMILKPPSLISKEVKNFTDGRIFHIITDGQGVMGSYILQIPKSEDRWALVNYIRKLQSSKKGIK